MKANTDKRVAKFDPREFRDVEPAPGLHWFALLVGLVLAVDVAVLFTQGKWNTFVDLLGQAIATPLLFPLALVLLFKVSLELPGLLRLLWLAPMFLIPVNMLVWGAVLKGSVSQAFTPWIVDSLGWAFYLVAGLAVLGIAINQRRRWLDVAAGLALIAFAFVCSITAGSAVTGDWI